VAFEFGRWAQPDLPIEGKDGRRYFAPPPSVQDGKAIIALTVVAEHRIGLVKSEPDPAMVKLAESITEDLAVLTLGREVRDQMVTDGLSEMTIARAGYYAMWFWSAGEAAADGICALMWGTDEVTDTAPKAQRPSKSGPNTA
jgi:hypothetical protein